MRHSAPTDAQRYTGQSHIGLTRQSVNVLGGFKVPLAVTAIARDGSFPVPEHCSSELF